VYRFDPRLRLMSVLTAGPEGLDIITKGAPEAVLVRCSGLTPQARGRASAEVTRLGACGLRVLAVARRRLPATTATREEAERDLTLLGLVALQDPPRAEVPAAVTACHRAGIRIHVVTGDNGVTAGEIARQVGIGGPVGPRVVADSETLDDAALDALLAEPGEIVFARAAPETKLRIADALREAGHVVAMTGDGVNDAPALHRADIGVAMGASGTDVAREAATMVLTDDNFATIAAAVESGRQVYDNVRKFIVYIFAHAVPEIVPFLVFALAAGQVPLPLTVLQILAIDLGTETFPALALGREPAEPGLMDRPPRRRSAGVVSRDMLVRAWGYLGLASAALVTAGFFAVLLHAGWHPGDNVAAGTPLHHAYLQATTATFAGIVMCQVGTALAARTESASLRSVGLTTNRLLLWGIAFELCFTATLIYLPPVQGVFGTAALPWWVLVMMAPFPVLVWGLDELRRARIRRRPAQWN
jgi:magnesium-transporting ATPase (P-type)